MKFWKNLAVISIIVSGSCSAYASEITLNEIVAKMDSAEKKIESLQFGFTQEIVYGITGERQSNSGEAVFQKPDNLYMKQQNPIEQVIVSNGRKVWIYTPAYRQVIVDKWKKWASSSMIPASMTNFGESISDLRLKYDFTYAGVDNSMYVLVLVPKKKEQWQLKLWIDQESFLPVVTCLTGENVSITTETSSLKVNPKLDIRMFNFQPPAGVEVLNLP